jgi:hypothetical protein
MPPQQAYGLLDFIGQVFGLSAHPALSPHLSKSKAAPF